MTDDFFINRKRNRQPNDSNKRSCTESADDSDNGYFEVDVEPLKNSIVKHILNKLSKDQRKGLSKKIKSGVEEGFELCDDLLQESYGTLLQRTPTSNLWKLGLGPKQIKKYEGKLERLRKGRDISMVDILDSPVEDRVKIKMLGLYDILQSLERYSNEYMVISAELSEMLEVNTTDSLKVRIDNADLPPGHREAVNEKYAQLQKTPDDSGTFAGIEEWIEEAIKTPFTRIKRVETTDIPGTLANLKTIFHKRLFGMNDVLEPLLTMFNNRLKNPDSQTLFIGLQGSPGTGKSSVSKVIAEVFDLPLKQISLGGMLDSSILDGQHPGWLGSSPGRFVKALQEMGVINGVLFLDEIDKLGETRHGLQVQYSLLHATDPTQNAHFIDHYLGNKLPLNLSKCLIICAMNGTSGIDPALLNRMHIIKIPDYKNEEKLLIMKNYLFPDAVKNAGLTTGDLILTDSACKKIISLCKKEGGVRGVKNALRNIVDKLGLLLSVKGEIKLSYDVDVSSRPVIITPDIVSKLIKTEDRMWEGMYL